MAQRPNAARQQQPAAAAPPPPPPSNYDEVSTAIERAVADCGVLAVANLPQIQQALRMARGIAALRQALTEDFMRDVLMPLMGSALGFLADRPNTREPTPYPVTVVRDCCIEALLRGFRVVGNEFNIISGRFYGAKAGFERQVTEYPGLTDLAMEPGVPNINMEKGGAVVPFIASWKLDGKPMRIDCLASTGPGVLDSRIPVKVNAQMGADAVIGKAYRKMYFRIWQRLTGSAFGMVDGEVTDTDAILTTGTPAPAAPPSTPPPGGAANRGQNSAARLDAIMDAQAKKPPASELTVELLLRELGAADEAWRDPPAGCLNGWSPDDRRAAFNWARAFNDPTVEDASIPERPACTLLGRQPGED